MANLRWRRISALVIGFFMLSGFLNGCIFLKPMPEGQGIESRLKAFPASGLPLHAPADIFWNEHQIPFIHTHDDRDLPFLIGMVHAHLRLAQMELLRHASQGRLSELMGPFTVNIDHLIRTIDFGKAVPQIKSGLPPETREWLQAYSRGINHYVKNCSDLPPELSLLGINFEPWTVDDVLTVGRLMTTDVNWLYWSMQFAIKAQPAWTELWTRLKDYGQNSLPSYQPAENLPAEIMLGASKAGSNSFVVSGQRTQSGSGLIASDPHVGLQLPPLWVIIAFQSPSYHVVGFSLPGQPFVVVGRNAAIAWGGTNMLSLSSTFYDISGPSFDQLSERKERIKVRWWLDRPVSIRNSSLGPVVTDVKYFKKSNLPRLALKWRGHAPSDESSAFLNISRASNWDEFKAAFASWAVSGQNFLYADKKGNIGQLMAVEFWPAAARAAEQFFGDPQNPGHIWNSSLKSTELPAVFNPEQGFLVSTNNTPIKSNPPISLFGNSNDRFLTISAELKGNQRINIDDLKQIQTNVFSRNSLQLARTLVAQATNPPAETENLLKAIAAWDGHYAMDSAGAAALELTAFYLAQNYYTAKYGENIADAVTRSPAVYTFLYEDLQSGQMASYLPDALKQAAAKFEKHNTWASLHILRLSHPLGNAPLIGRKYRFGDYAVPGSSNTIYKSAHALAGGPHRVTYGANARHVSDLSDPDENYFALVGGQDGYWSSDNFLDLYQLWRKRQYVRVPLRLETVRRTFAHHMTLGP
jgi:penicillin amidase